MLVANDILLRLGNLKQKQALNFSVFWKRSRVLIKLMMQFDCSHQQIISKPPIF